MVDIPRSVIDTLIAEAAGEGPEGMRRVAETILNRAAIRGLSPEQVVQQRSQYTGYSNPGPGAVRAQGNPTTRAAAEAAWRLALEPGDPTGGADHYYAPGVVSEPSWARSMTPTGQYGGHAFFSSRPIPPGEIPNTVGTLTDTVPRTPPVPVTMTPDLSLLRNPAMSAEARAAQVTPTANVPLPRRRPSPAASGAARGSAIADSIAQSPIQGGAQMSPMFDAGYDTRLGSMRMMSAPMANAGVGFAASPAPAPVPATMSPQVASLRARDQDLQMALNQRYPPTRLPPLPPSAIGQPPATRVVPSVPMNMEPTPQEIARAAGTTIATIPTKAPVPMPRGVQQTYAAQDGLQPREYIPDRLMPSGPLVPQTAGVTLNQPPIQVVPNPSLAPRLAAPMPMPASMRPFGGATPVARPMVAPRPMPIQARPAAPLRVVVQRDAVVPRPMPRLAPAQVYALANAGNNRPSVEDRVRGSSGLSAYSGGASSIYG